MPTKVNRAELLAKLQAIQPGTATHDRAVEQASCFIFRSGLAQSYNDDVACTIASGLPEEFSGAVPAAKFLALLSKMAEEDIDLEWSDSEVVVSGRKGRKSGFRLEAEILSAVDSVEQPKEEEWKPLPEGFGEAVSIVQECAGDEKQFITNVVNIHQKWLEAGDDVQCVRYKIKTDVKTPVMVRQKAIKHVSTLGMTEFFDADSWLHFRNPQGLTFSCRCFIDPPYPTDEISAVLKQKDGHPMTLPKGLVDSVDLAETIIAGDKGSSVLISLKPGRLNFKAVSSDGCWHKEAKKIAYEGNAMSFFISPKLLKDLVTKHHDVIVMEDKLRVDGGSYTYLSCLGIPEEESPAAEPVAAMADGEE